MQLGKFPIITLAAAAVFLHASLAWSADEDNSVQRVIADLANGTPAQQEDRLRELSQDGKLHQHVFDTLQSVAAKYSKVDDDTREQALKALGQMGRVFIVTTPDILPILTANLRANDTAVQETAADEIARIAKAAPTILQEHSADVEKAGEMLTPLLTQPIPPMREAAKKAILALKPSGTEFKRLLAMREDPETQTFAKQYFGPSWPDEYARQRIQPSFLKDQLNRSRFMKALTNQDPELRAACVRQLIVSQDPRAYEAAKNAYGPGWTASPTGRTVRPEDMVSLLQSGNPEISKAAQDALAQIRPESEEFKKALISTRDQGVFEFAQKLFGTGEWQKIFGRLGKPAVFTLARDGNLGKLMPAGEALTQITKNAPTGTQVEFKKGGEAEAEIPNLAGKAVISVTPDGNVNRKITLFTTDDNQVFGGAVDEETLHTQLSANAGAASGAAQFFTTPESQFEAQVRAARGLPPAEALPDQFDSMKDLMNESLDPSKFPLCNTSIVCPPAANLNNLDQPQLKAELMRQLSPALTPEGLKAFDSSLDKELGEYFYYKNQPHAGFGGSVLRTHIARALAGSILNGTDGLDKVMDINGLMQTAAFSAAMTVQTSAINRYLLTPEAPKPIYSAPEMYEGFAEDRATRSFSAAIANVTKGEWIMRHSASTAVAMEVMTLAKLLQENPKMAEEYLMKGYALRDAAAGTAMYIIPRTFISPIVKNASRAIRGLNMVREGVAVCSGPVGLAEEAVEETAILVASFLLQDFVSSKVYPFFERVQARWQLSGMNSDVQNELYKDTRDAQPIIPGHIEPVRNSLNDGTFFVPTRMLAGAEGAKVEAAGTVRRIHEEFETSREVIKSKYEAKLADYAKDRQELVKDWERTFPNPTSFRDFLHNRHFGDDFWAEAQRQRMAADITDHDHKFLAKTKDLRQETLGPSSGALDWEKDAQAVLNGNPGAHNRFSDEKDLMSFLTKLPSSLKESYVRENYYLQALGKLSEHVGTDYRRDVQKASEVFADQLPQLEKIQRDFLETPPATLPPAP